MKPDTPGKTRKSVWDYGKIVILNSWCRLIILGRYTLICWQQQKLRRACRRLGTQVLAALESGEVNPLLTDGVKDTLKAARGLKERKDRHYQAIAAWREKMRAAYAGASHPQPDDAGESNQPGNKTE